MRFNQPRPKFDPTIATAVKREIKRQNMSLFKAKPSHLKQIKKISGEIQQSELPNHLVRKKLPDNLGYGIFLRPNAKPIRKGQVIAPYSGDLYLNPKNVEDDSLYAFSCMSDIRLLKDEHAQLIRNRGYHPRRLYELTLDAAERGNFTRFINHSSKPNIIAELVRIPRNRLGVEPAPIEVVYFAHKTILPGQQLLVCYEGDGATYWGAMGVEPVPMFPSTYVLGDDLNLVYNPGCMKNL